MFVRELGEYLRGRAPGDVPGPLPERARRREAFCPRPSRVVDSEVDALERALDGAAAGDFVAVLVHLDQAEVQAFFAARAAAAPDIS